jgi:hypothetical protein
MEERDDRAREERGQPIEQGRPSSPPPAPPLDRGAGSDPEPGAATAWAAVRRPSPLEALAERAAPVAFVAGLFGALSGPLLVTSGVGRYLILTLDVLALAAGGLGIWGGLRRVARLDYAVAGIVMGAFSLYLWISYVSDPPPSGT